MPSYNERFGYGSPLPANLKLHVPMQETSGDFVYDRSADPAIGDMDGHGGNLQTNPGPRTYLPSSVKFDGIADQTSFGNVSKVAFRGKQDVFSGGAWIRKGSVKEAGYIFGKNRPQPGEGWGFYVGDGFLAITMANSIADGAEVATSLVNTTAWIFVSFRAVSGAVAFFVNGEYIGFDSIFSNNPADVTSDFTLGNRTAGTSAGTWFDGDMCGVCIFDVGLDAGEWTEVYNGPEPLKTTAPTISTTGQVTSGTHDSQLNGPVTLSTTLYEGGVNTHTLAGTNPNFSSFIVPGNSYYVTESPSNLGGNDPTQNQQSATVVAPAAGTSFTPITFQSAEKTSGLPTGALAEMETYYDAGSTNQKFIGIKIPVNFNLTNLTLTLDIDQVPSAGTTAGIYVHGPYVNANFPADGDAYLAAVSGKPSVLITETAVRTAGVGNSIALNLNSLVNGQTAGSSMLFIVRTNGNQGSTSLQKYRFSDPVATTTDVQGGGGNTDLPAIVIESLSQIQASAPYRSGLPAVTVESLSRIELASPYASGLPAVSIESLSQFQTESPYEDALPSTTMESASEILANSPTIDGQITTTDTESLSLFVAESPYEDTIPSLAVDSISEFLVQSPTVEVADEAVTVDVESLSAFTAVSPYSSDVGIVSPRKSIFLSQIFN